MVDGEMLSVAGPSLRSPQIQVGRGAECLKGPPNAILRASLVPATRITDAFRPIAFNKGSPNLNITIYMVRYPMEGTQVSLWSNLGMLLAEHNMSVLALHKRLQEKGVSVNLKSLYRLAGSQPLQKLDARIVKPICFVLGIGLSGLISLDKPELSLLKLDSVTQARITTLLDKNNQGTITKTERAELERLVDKAERISLHNARALVEYRRGRADRTEGTGRGLKHRPEKESGAAISA
jgi:hypothetical protein